MPAKNREEQLRLIQLSKETEDELAARDSRLRKKWEDYDRQLKPVLNRLHELGLVAESLEEAVVRYAPLSDEIVQALMPAFDELTSENVVESLVRALCAAKNPYDGRPLEATFKKFKNAMGLQFAIVNTIAHSKPQNIDSFIEWIENHDYWGEKLRKLSPKRRKKKT